MLSRAHVEMALLSVELYEKGTNTLI